MGKETDPKRHDRSSAVDALVASVRARDALEEAITQQVRECRRSGVSWQEIAALTGVSKPTAMTKWKEKVTTVTEAWTLEPGDIIRRRDLHDQYGGNRQSGISTPQHGNDIF